MKPVNPDVGKKTQKEKNDWVGKVVGIIGGVASLVAIIVFITGRENLQGLFGPKTTPQPQYVFQDDFSDPASGWDVSTDEISSRSYQDGEYVMRAGPGISGSGTSSLSSVYGKCYNNWSPAGLSHVTDVAIDVDARYLGGSTYGAYGVLFYYQDSSHFYYYEVVPIDSGWDLVRRVPEGFYDQIAFQEAPAIRAGMSTNHIRIELGDSIALYINDQLISTVQIPYQTGDVGLWAVSCSNEVFGVAFDNFAVTRLR